MFPNPNRIPIPNPYLTSPRHLFDRRQTVFDLRSPLWRNVIILLDCCGNSGSTDQHQLSHLFSDFHDPQADTSLVSRKLHLSQPLPSWHDCLGIVCRNPACLSAGAGMGFSALQLGTSRTSRCADQIDGARHRNGSMPMFMRRLTVLGHRWCAASTARGDVGCLDASSGLEVGFTNQNDVGLRERSARRRQFRPMFS